MPTKLGYHTISTWSSLGVRVAAMAVLGFLTSCQTDPVGSDLDAYYLAWRMVSSMEDGDFPAAKVKYDSLGREKIAGMGSMIIQTSVMLQVMTGDSAEAIELLKQIPPDRSRGLCEIGQLSSTTYCKSMPARAPVEKPEWQRRLLMHSVRDQGARGNLREALAAELGMDISDWQRWRNEDVEGDGRSLLNTYIADHGFPTVEQVGRDGMNAVFLILQHADQDPAWQASQLAAVTDAVANGDMSAHDLAYLTDRVRVNADRPQLYGTQVARMDPQARTVKLYPVEDSLHLDQRRMEAGMMPVSRYVELLLREE